MDVAYGRDVVARWCNLAEQRLEHLTEMFETGRWRRYHSEAAFLENIQEAKSAVELWRSLSTGGASADHSTIERPWLRVRKSPLPRFEMLIDQAPPPQPADTPDQPLLSAVEAALVCSDDAPSAPAMQTPDVDPASDDAGEPALEIGAIGHRYPQLHNAL
jgi:uncharacterized repeat protein (TIGR03809 family)